jgi:oxygen-independent coproporphyrinogen-3 oxidase
MQEHLMVGLRLLIEGVSNKTFFETYGSPLEQVFAKQIDRLERDGLLEWDPTSGDRLRLSRRGWMLGNRVFSEFIDLPEPV